MRRVFVKNILFLLTINMLVKSVWIFMIDRTVQNRVGHEAYGIYQALFNLGIIFQIILDFGLNSYNTRVISREPGRLKELFPVMFSTRLVLILIYIAAVCGTGWLIGFRGHELLLLAGILLIQSFSMLLLYLRSNVGALQLFRLDGLLSVADRFLMILVCGVLLLLPAGMFEFRIEWFVIAQIICYGLTFVAALLVLRRLAGISLRFSFRFADMVNVIRSSLPYALLIFLMAVYTRADMLLIERISGPDGKEQAGIYASAFRLLDVGNIFGLLFSGMLFPMFGKMLAEKKNPAPIIRIAVNIMLPLSFIAAIACSVYGDEIMRALYVEATDYDGRVLGWLMASFPAFCMMYVYCTLLTANGNLKLLNILAVAGAVVNMTANFILIPEYQALGAAAVAFCTQTMMALGFIIFGGRKLALPFHRKWVVAHCVFPLVCIAVSCGISMLPLPWIWGLVLFSTVSFLMAFVFRFITMQSVRQLFAR